ncbi:sorting nexin-14-like [Ctenocephalides felis]|uniref:sorting nexin-14-like n=1 Tax=Ctenocephalides felis TaxID=7515 RepID=UPI000E6E1674|nr:sorting nexin-14-like [Ctenocephalides felis]
MDKKTLMLLAEYWKDPVAKISITTTLTISVLIALVYSTFSACTIIFSYILGCIVCGLIILYKDVIFKYIPQFCTLFGYRDLQKPSVPGKLIECDLCNNGKCLRHKPKPIKEPWNNLYIHRDLDHSIKQLYEKILENFVIGWYQDVSKDKRFEYAVKKSLKYSTSIVLRRVKQIDFSILLMDKLLPVALSHLYGVSKSMKSRKNIDSNTGGNFMICAKPYVQHYALKDRNTEIEYIRTITEKLMPLLIDKEDHECRNFISLIREILSCWVLLPLTDCLADPTIINNIIISIFSNTKEYDDDLKNKQVPLLKEFYIMPKPLTFIQGKSTLALLLKNHSLLYCFMQYLKRTDRINLLQFCLHIDDMNNMLMRPAPTGLPNSTGNSKDIKQKHLDRLQNSLQSVMNVYLRNNSSDQLMQFVTISPKHLKDIEAVTKMDPEKVGLATVAPIYELYDKVFSYLDGLLNDFYTSPEFLELTYGPKNPVEVCKTSINSSLRPRQHQNQANQSPLQLSQTQSRLSNISTKIKGALRGGPVDGQLLPNSSFYTMEYTGHQSHYPKLSDYIVKVHSVENTNGSQTSEALFRVHCEVQIYPLPNSMLPNYSPNNFVTPHNVMQTVKEKSFHTLRNEVGSTGEWDVLPDVRTHSLEERRLSYELFLQSLVANKSLSRKQQERVASFLMPPTSSGLLCSNIDGQHDENIIASGGMASDGNIGANLYQSVAHKLRKERGQHLQCFTSALFKSVQEYGSNGNYPSNTEDINGKNEILRNSTHASEKMINKRLSNNRFSLVFGDHFRESQRFDGDEYFHTSMPSVVRGPSQCILFLLVRLLSAPKFVIRVVLALSNFFGTFLDKIINCLVQRKIVESSEICEIGLASLINMLTDTLFPATKPEKIEKSVVASNNALLCETAKQKLHKFSNTKRLSKYWPELSRCLLEMHQALQHPTLNKQLVYSLFDIVITEIFPEILN